MNKVLKVFLRIMAPALIGGAVFLSCNKAPPPDTGEVSAFTGGIILRSDPVEVVFTQAHDTSIPLPEGIIRLKPVVEGTVFWKDEYTLTFTPSSLLKGDTEYTVTVDEKKPDRRPFAFKFKTQPPLLEVTVDPVRIDESGDILVEGFVTVDKGTPLEQIEKIIGSSELGEAEWTHQDDSHRFRFQPVKTGESIRTAAITWSGRSLGSREEGFTTVRIPGSAVFEMVELRQNGGVLEVAFSAPIKSYSDLRGFVSLSGNTDVRYSLEGNVVKIFGSQGGAEGIPPGAELLIQDLEDINGNVLLTPVQYRVPDKWELPQARFTGTGVILPTSQGSTMVVETRNLSGILVEAFEVYGANMVQFLQVNPLSGERELNRVGEPVWTKAIDFDWKDSYKNLWVRQGLDLSELAARHPGSMFRLRLSFRPRHVKYECTLNHGDYSNLSFPDDSFKAYSGSNGDENSYWDYYQESPGYSWYDWYQKRLDPCHPAFYMPFGDHNITVGKNVLVSDLGLLAKRSLDGSWVIAAGNIKTAQPAGDAEIRLLNYQGRLLYQTRTGADGMAVLPNAASLALPGTPALVSARTGFGTAWLKIDDSLALASSHFDVSGEKPADGIRGLLYGERGVWRPGDNIYLTFLLSDPAATLPPDHPVSFELQDPRGRITMERTYTSSVDGFYPIAAATAADALTGDWNARVRVGGNVFNKTLKVETVMPNRLKMDLDFGSKPYIEAGRTPASLIAEWLYGAPAPGLKADISVSLEDKETTFPTYGDYSFRDPSRRASFERQTVWEGTLDDAGKAAFNVELNGGTAAPGKMNARFMTRVFEPSGVFSSEQVSMDFSPYERYVGIKLPRGDAARNMLLTDTDHQADIVVLDSEGKPAPGEISLDCAVYKLSWRWWWEKGSVEAAEFASALSRSPITRGQAVSRNGKASWTFNVKYPEWGRYLVVARDAAGGHAAASLVYIDWPGWAGRAQEGGQGSQAMLVLNAEKPGYNVGEAVSLSFPSNKDAAALVMVEKGGRIIKREWVSCGDGTTRYVFGAEPSMAPNVYVHVTMLQPHLQTRNDLPLRLYGIIPIMVEDPRTRISPRITVPDTWQPESRVSFEVNEAEGRPMVYTVAVVDEGLLGLTRYSLPNPRSTFYAREASFLKSWDLYSDIMGAFSGRLETLLAIGGGDDSMDNTNKETQRFKPVVRFFGPYELEPGETRTETFDLPPYVGALRVMVMAASSTAEAQPGPGRSQRAYGAAEKAVKVSSDLMVFGSLPRLLSPGDEAEIPVTVSSYKEGARNVRVALSAPGASVIGQAVQNVSFEKTGEKTIRFIVKAPDLPGTLRFNINAESPGLRAASHEVDMEVRSTSVPVTRSLQYLIGAGETWRGTLEFPGRTGSNSGVIELSRLPPLNLEKRLDYLVRYPHGCVEQTTSAVFPQLYLNRILDLEGEKAAEIRRNISSGIERLAGFQTASGGFAYWPGNGFANDWGTTYAGHFLVEARRAGYEVPEHIIKSWLYFQKDQARLWQARSNTYTEQAYRLYTIALAGEADLGSMNRLREQRNLDPRAAWRLAAAYWYAGQRDTARNMVKDLTIPSSEYRELSGTFGSVFRDKAMILETLILMEEPGRTRALFEELSSVLSGDNWLSTQETAYALIAMAPYMEGVKASGFINVDCALAGSAESVSFDSPVTQLDMGSLSGTGGAFSLANRSSFPVYARVTAKGLPEEGSEPPLSEGLSLTVEYRDTGGKIIDPDALKLGDDMEVRVTVKNSYARELSEIALVHPIPASWELINYRLGGGASSSSFKYQDIRDDRVMTYFDLNRGGEKVVSFRVNKTYGGKYFRPAIHAYAMYDESIRALAPGVK